MVAQTRNGTPEVTGDALEANKAIVRRFFEEGVNKRDMGVVYELISPDYIGIPSGIRGPEGEQRAIEAFHRTFEGFHFVIEQQLAEGDRVMTRMTAHGIHRDTFLGVPATGKRVSWTWFGVRRVVGGKIVEGSGIKDNLSLLRQMGATIVAPQDGRPDTNE